MILEISEAILTRAKATTLWSDLSGQFWFSEAPQPVSGPYCVYRFTGSDRVEVMGTKDDGIINSSWDFILCTEADDGGVSISALSGALHEAFAWCTLSIGGYSFIACKPEDIMPLYNEGDIWQITALYTVMVEKE